MAMRVYIVEKGCCGELPDLSQRWYGLLGWNWNTDVGDLIGYFGGYDDEHPDCVSFDRDLRMLSFETEETFETWSEDIKSFNDLEKRLDELSRKYGDEAVCEIVEPYWDILHDNDFEHQFHGGSFVYMDEFVTWLNKDLDVAFIPVDKIRFEFIDDRIEYEDADVVLARTIINERPLLDIVREYELPYIGEDRAGGYLYQPAGDLYMQITDPDFRQRDKNEIGLLICGCFVEGCWPFYARMEETAACVIWSDFHNPHLSKYRGIAVDYGNFGSFRFDRDEFWREVEKLKQYAYTKT